MADPDPAAAPRSDELERQVRQTLWLNHGCVPSVLYGDDGEQQCSACGLDFKRQPWPDLLLRLFALGRLHAGVAARPLGLAEVKNWRCFQCDEVFTDEAEAREHFGSTEWKTPACRLGVEDVAQLRELEATNATLRRENEELENDARLWHEAETDRVRRIGNVQWWQALDSWEGEKLVLQEQLAVRPLGRLRALIDRLENYYGFECEGGPLRKCVEWQELKAALLPGEEGK